MLRYARHLSPSFERDRGQVLQALNRWIEQASLPPAIDLLVLDLFRGPGTSGESADALVVARTIRFRAQARELSDARLGRLPHVGMELAAAARQHEALSVDPFVNLTERLGLARVVLAPFVEYFVQSFRVITAPQKVVSAIKSGQFDLQHALGFGLAATGVGSFVNWCLPTPAISPVSAPIIGDLAVIMLQFAANAALILILRHVVWRKVAVVSLKEALLAGFVASASIYPMQVLLVGADTALGSVLLTGLALLWSFIIVIELLSYTYMRPKLQVFWRALLASAVALPLVALCLVPLVR